MRKRYEFTMPTAEVDQHFRIPTRSAMPDDLFDADMDRSLRKELGAEPALQGAYIFVCWSVREGLLKAPKTPSLLAAEFREHPYRYYPTFFMALEEALEGYRERIPALLERFKAAYPECADLEIALPDTPSKIFTDGIPKASIAMGSREVGTYGELGKLSPLGAIWRAYTLKGLLKSLQVLEKKPEFGIFATIHPPTLERYFLLVHPTCYMSGPVDFRGLPPSDVTAVMQAVYLGSKQHPRQFLERAVQLVGESLNGAPVGLWVRNAVADVSHLLGGDRSKRGKTETRTHQLIAGIISGTREIGELAQVGVILPRQSQLAATNALSR